MELPDTFRLDCVCASVAGHVGGPMSPHLLALPGAMSPGSVRPVPPTTALLRETLATSEGRGRKLSLCGLIVFAVIAVRLKPKEFDAGV